MKMEEEIALLERFVHSSEWEYMKSKLLEMRNNEERKLKSVVIEGDSSKSAYLGGYIKGLEFMENMPENLLANRKMTLNFFKNKVKEKFTMELNKFKNLQYRLHDMFFRSDEKENAHLQ